MKHSQKEIVKLAVLGALGEVYGTKTLRTFLKSHRGKPAKTGKTKTSSIFS